VIRTGDILFPQATVVYVPFLPLCFVKNPFFPAGVKKGTTLFPRERCSRPTPRAESPQTYPLIPFPFDLQTRIPPFPPFGADLYSRRGVLPPPVLSNPLKSLSFPFVRNVFLPFFDRLKRETSAPDETAPGVLFSFRHPLSMTFFPPLRPPPSWPDTDASPSAQPPFRETTMLKPLP